MLYPAYSLATPQVSSSGSFRTISFEFKTVRSANYKLSIQTIGWDGGIGDWNVNKAFGIRYAQSGSVTIENLDSTEKYRFSVRCGIELSDARWSSVPGVAWVRLEVIVADLSKLP